MPSGQAFDSLVNMVLGTELPATDAVTIALRARLLIALGALGAATVNIGGGVVGGTTGSVLFVGAGGLLAQDNASFFWNNTTKTITIKSPGPIGNSGMVEWFLTNTLPFISVRQNGTFAAPTGVLLNDIIGGFGANGHNGVGNTGTRASFKFQAAENWAVGGNGTYLVFNTTGIGITNELERLRITDVGNEGLGTITPGGSGTIGTKVFSIGNGTPPVGGVADQVSLFSNDVAASAELFALDEAGNTPQLTPHPADFLDTLPLADRPYPWAYSSENKYLGKKIQVDMAGLVAEVEKLSGKQFAFVSDIDPQDRIEWNAGQEAQIKLRQIQIDQETKKKNDIQANLDREMDISKRFELQEQLASIIVPKPHIQKPPPKWMINRGVK